MMRHDTMYAIRFVLMVVGVVPRNWQDPWKLKCFKMYAAFLDAHFSVYVMAKILYTLQDSKYDQEIVAFFEGWFESTVILSITLQRFVLRWKVDQLMEIIERLESLNKGDDCKTVDRYEKLACNINLCFGLLSLMEYLQLVVNYFLNYCEHPGYKKTDFACRNFLVEIWLPFETLTPSWYFVLSVYNIFQTVVATAMLYLSLIIIPIFITKVTSEFQIIAESFQNNLQVTKILVCSEDQVTEEIVGIIKRHQMILGLCGLMNKMFHVILLLKLVFQSLPMVLVALTLSKVEFGSFQFLRFILLLAAPTSELFTFCYFGEQLQSHSLKIQRAVYMNHWYRMSKVNRRLLLLVAIRSGRPARLEVWPHFIPASLETFLNVCHLSYSLYSFFTGTTSKKIS